MRRWRKEKRWNLRRLRFRFRDCLLVPMVLMVIGSIAVAAHGTTLVVYLHFFGKVIQLLSFSGHEEELFDEFTKHALYIVYIVAGVFAAGWIEVSCWILTGERQTTVIRSKYVQVLLNQDMSFFDTYGKNGDIVSQVLSDVLLIQSALSEKVGNYIHNMATFFGGLIIGLISCWQITLITLATGPFIVAAGGISNIFLHRLAENIQDAYAEAASIAEQMAFYSVFLLCLLGYNTMVELLVDIVLLPNETAYTGNMVRLRVNGKETVTVL